MIEETKDSSKKEHSYEANCLISLRNEGKIEELAKKMQDWIEKRGGSLLNPKKNKPEGGTESESLFWVEKRKLAYPVKKDYFGCYLSFWFKIETSKTVDFKKFLSLEEDLLRFQIFRSEEEDIFPTEGFAPLRDLASLKIRDDRERINYENRERPMEKKSGIEKDVVEKSDVETGTSDVETGTSDVETGASDVETGTSDVETGASDVETGLRPVFPEAKTETKKEEEKEVDKVEARSSRPEEKTVEIVKEAEMIEEIKPAVEKSVPVDEEIKEEIKTEEVKAKKGKEPKKQKKITLEELDDRLDDILNEEII